MSSKQAKVILKLTETTKMIKILTKNDCKRYQND